MMYDIPSQIHITCGTLIPQEESFGKETVAYSSEALSFFGYSAVYNNFTLDNYISFAFFNAKENEDFHGKVQFKYDRIKFYHT